MKELLEIIHRYYEVTTDYYGVMADTIDEYYERAKIDCNDEMMYELRKLKNKLKRVSVANDNAFENLLDNKVN